MPDRYGAPSTLATGGAATFGTAPAAPTATTNPNAIFADPSNPGYYTDGRNYFKKNADGSFTQSHDLDLGSQVARNLEQAQNYGGSATQDQADFNAIFGSQNNLAGQLNNTITNPDAPSVAHQQLDEALQANDASQLSNAAGVGGQNASLARTNAANNMAGLGANSSQAAALTRAQEVAAATGQLNSLLGAQSGEASGMYVTNTNLNQGFSQLAGGEEGAGNTNVTQQRAADINAATDVGKAAATGGGSALASGASSGGGGGPNALAPVSFNETLSSPSDDEYTKKLKNRGLYG